VKFSWRAESRRQKIGPISGAKSKEANGRDVQERHSKVLLPLKEQLAMGREYQNKKRIELIDCAASFLFAEFALAAPNFENTCPAWAPGVRHCWNKGWGGWPDSCSRVTFGTKLHNSAHRRQLLVRGWDLCLWRILSSDSLDARTGRFEMLESTFLWKELLQH